MLLIAKGITGGGVLHTDGSGDITGINDVEVASVVRVHHEDTANALLLILGRVVNCASLCERTGVHAEEAELTDVGIGHDLERECREGLVIACLSLILLLGLGDHTLDRGDVERRGHEVDDSVKELLNALVLVGRTAADRNDQVGDGGGTKCDLELVDRDLITIAVLLKECLVGLGDRLNHCGAVLLGNLYHILGDRLNAHILTEVIVVYVCLHGHQVDDTAEAALLADRELDCDRIGMKPVLHHLNDTEKVGSGNVHLVDVRHSRDLVLVSLTPNGLGLGLNAALRAENGYRTVQNAKRALNLNGKVNVAGGINDVDTVLLPVAGGCSGGNGDSALLLLGHPVHRCTAVMGLAHAMGLTGIKQDTLGRRGLTCVDMGHDTDIPRFLK